ncbi:hypothetical protein [Ramlibacter sp. PS4R-6]|uniref:hypothetical protein n=1 Tax=Ramlibacter sp. PS4R-6 TaxID=3133438 RepID=UPI003096455C
MARANIVFLGCNYNDKKIKGQFDNLKKRIEADTPLSCIVIDKRSKKPARDLWQDIKKHIEESAACFFDLTGFRPNVVLELGYALSIKAEDQIFITFRKRKTKGRAPAWLLSDIGHLNRHEYISMMQLESFMRDQLTQIPFAEGTREFWVDCENTNAAEKYQQYGLRILQSIRDSGPQSEQQIQRTLRGSACRLSRMLSLLKKNRLIARPPGPNGKYLVPELPG